MTVIGHGGASALQQVVFGLCGGSQGVAAQGMVGGAAGALPLELGALARALVVVVGAVEEALPLLLPFPRGHRQQLQRHPHCGDA